jgi:hypothetical protein
MNTTEKPAKTGAGLYRAQEQLEDLGRTLGEKLDEARSGTADALESAASSVRTTGRRGAETIDNLSRNAAGKLDSSAAYVRSHDVGSMLGNLRQVIRRHPTGFVLLAAGIGFLAGSAARRNQNT